MRGLVALLLATSLAAQAPKPNVVLIIMDDIGYGDLGSYGATDIKTPSLDRLARQGVRFTESYANAAVCTPTRAALITGRYQQRAGLEWALGGGADTARGLAVTGASLPALLKTQGYATALFGKWHLGFRPAFGPNAHGFDHFWGFLAGYHDYYPHPQRADDLFEDTARAELHGYLTTEITDRAVDFIRANAARPFFVEVAYNAVHWPFQPPGHPYKPGDKPVIANQVPGDSSGATRAIYAQMMQSADSGVGRILRELEQRGLTRNTLVIFTNDNGGEWLSRNAPFFHRKGTLWEGGIRVPLIMRWPAQLPAGRVSQQVAITMDLTASVLNAAGATRPADAPGDGMDLIPVARGAKPVVERELFWRVVRPGHNQRAVRSGPWKLLIDGSGGAADVHPLLFDLRTDQGERHDVAAQYQDRVRELRMKLDAWEREVTPKAPQ